MSSYIIRINIIYMCISLLRYISIFIINNQFNILYILNNSKNKDTYGIHSLFIFEDITWSNIVLWFKLNNIILSGGNSTKRHLISSLDINLFISIIGLFEFKIVDLINIASQNNKDIYKKEVQSFYDKKIYKSLKNLLRAPQKIIQTS